VAELKTKKTGASVSAFLAAIPGQERRADCRALSAMMRRATGAPAKMWGPAIVGFGDCRYRYDSGREGDWFLVGFSPRKAQLSVYLMGGIDPKAPAMKKLGPHKAGKGCLYVKRLADLDLAVLEGLIEASVGRTRARYGA
jgi:hypothetical protein